MFFRPSRTLALPSGQHAFAAVDFATELPPNSPERRENPASAILCSGELLGWRFRLPWRAPPGVPILT